MASTPQSRVLDVYYENHIEMNISEVRLGRIYTMAQKGLLTAHTDEEIKTLLDPNNIEQYDRDVELVAHNDQQKKQYEK